MNNEKKSVVIIGGGHAGAESAVLLRQKGWTGKIHLISDEPVIPYQRPPLSKAYFHNSMKVEQLPIKKEALYEKLDVELTLGKTVQKINRDQQTITLDDGITLSYNHLIIATGARVRKLPIPGADLPIVSYLKTLNDADKIKSQVKDQANVLIVGAGYIGLEIAASATKVGAKVTVLEALDRVLARVTCPEMSAYFLQLHQKQGVDIKLNIGITEITSDKGITTAVFNNGTTQAFDCIIVGIGVIPNIELAKSAGLDCDNGITVNKYSQTSDPLIYAIGDVSNQPNELYATRLRLESVPNAIEQAKTAVNSICGTATPNIAFPWFWSDQYHAKLQTAGIFQGYNEVVVRGSMEGDAFTAFYLKDKKLIAVDSINSPRDFMKAKQLIPTGFIADTDKIKDTSNNWFE
jgi:3-phenylpropionate/trans-cinnamate dioxygenase ferredoxin reductase subunit